MLGAQFCSEILFTKQVSLQNFDKIGMIVQNKIQKEELKPPFIKAVADIEKEIISVDCELHIDCAEELVREGSEWKNLWGFNIYPDASVDFISLINIRPASRNRSMEIQNPEIRQKIESIFQKLL